MHRPVFVGTQCTRPSTIGRMQCAPTDATRMAAVPVLFVRKITEKTFEILASFFPNPGTFSESNPTPNSAELYLQYGMNGSGVAYFLLQCL